MPPRIAWGILVTVMAAIGGATVWGARTKPASVVPPSAVVPTSTTVPRILPIYGKVPETGLIDSSANRFSLSELKGTVWIADFIFTSCAGQCPQMNERMRWLQAQLEKSVKLVSISVDPRRDTPSVLADFSKKLGADPDRWIFLTGSPSAIESLAKESFRLSYAEGTDPKEPITHSVKFVLVDTTGAIRGYYDGLDPKALKMLREDTRALLKDAQALVSPSR